VPVHLISTGFAVLYGLRLYLRVLCRRTRRRAGSEHAGWSGRPGRRAGLPV